MPRHGSKAFEIDHIYHFAHHVSDIFPDDTNKTVTITAGAAINTFGAWAAIVDNIPAELSTVFADADGLICCILVEECSLNDKRYVLEVSYGAARVVIARTRFMKEQNIMNVSHQIRIRSMEIPAGETVYYRLKCETANATAEVHFRYYLV